MSVWKSDEKLLIFVSLISTLLCLRSNIKHSTKIICASHFQLSSQCFMLDTLLKSIIIMNTYMQIN